MPSILVIYNPTAGRGRVIKHWEEIRQGLIEAGIEFDVAATSAPLEAIRIAQQAAVRSMTRCFLWDLQHSAFTNHS